LTEDRIVVFRPGALGDTILTFDALAALRRATPRAVIELVGNAAAGALLAEGGLVDAVLAFDSLEVTGLFQRPALLPERWRGARLVVLWLGSDTGLARVFHAAGATSILHASPAPPRGVHVADHLTRSLGAADVAPASGSESWRLSLGGTPSPSPSPPCAGEREFSVQIAPPPSLSPPCAGEKEVLGEIPPWPALAPRAGSFASERSLDGRPRVLVHPGSGSARKNWPAERFADLARRLTRAGWSVSLLHGPADAGAVAEVRSAFGSLGRDLPVIRPPDVSSLAQCIGATDLLVANDSGVAHVAARLGVPTVAIFGPTDPEQWAPRGPAVEAVGGRGTWPGVEEVLRASEGLSRGLAGPVHSQGERRR
jgi:ADP-heptose:LPS heptosyltransferase